MNAGYGEKGTRLEDHRALSRHPPDEAPQRDAALQRTVRRRHVEQRSRLHELPAHRGRRLHDANSDPRSSRLEPHDDAGVEIRASSRRITRRCAKRSKKRRRRSARASTSSRSNRVISAISPRRSQASQRAKRLALAVVKHIKDEFLEVRPGDRVRNAETRPRPSHRRRHGKGRSACNDAVTGSDRRDPSARLLRPN